MDKQKLQTLKGFRDFLPAEAKKRQYTIDIIRRTFETCGFEPLETPAIEYQEVLLGKYGEEADKLVYQFEDLGGRPVALRYDQTVPTARVLAMYNQQLPTPFRRYQIQTVWRAEKPQSGRFREFLQCDADLYGSASPLADAEVIALSNLLYKNLGFSKYKIFINDRNILFKLMASAGIPEALHFRAIIEIDKLDRKSIDEVSESLKTIGISQENIDHLFHHLDEEQSPDNLKKVIEYSQKLGVEEDKLHFQARLARGLDYYTSTIFEIKIDEYKAGSVLGGGRYDKLIGKLSGVDMSATGFALGFDRTIEAMEQFKLFPPIQQRNSVLVSVFSPELSDESALVVANLRENNISAELYPDEGIKLDKQLKYADKKGIKWLVVIGPEEAEKNSVILKDLETGRQEDIKLEDLVNKLMKSSQ
ncbi:histidine--tRNA ligase [Candidatus Woesebacteria bacterium RIFCSPLOWO2_01_FULL_39_61]|uniref:Histidine--tRNA ligase n=1 Tax=Candidatus Woesebacteria bacterium RIFCSPHIGHO2_02_FULL_39_13 TaxID=1802505 RepID=A0A1F7Z140_9BACT|nr:MAG: histidine--tRNA ligase [Candidatus Woesebacteria bacterium RIFCSPHIGHO2_01_FULL_39_95]OGM33267.1 MAG: histidine--tRNA ligase [Candidatus Woesebacteria bacterium RIFCSPHIGHO2_02_FULL_39_13]OGM38439.1 MAG: histidine--tRNA ligase [Candidatus Woesebacteria bacterium RIFCSPHIGHO2_12_FULL_40_20]OGM66877.1 MAG: histidine--tRNA ligase [Candidatus Woesebacteria bacterium RIFCSPLOWO2_01_FULL_39_61]OGM75316.1 MAG: histidine--tRNA ligase [Candidatus Woesebacteria bacterium RIFCSPLOWO2_12_FULL_39_9]